MTPSSCPYCQAPLPAAKPGAIQPVSICPACGRAIVTGAPVGGGSGAHKPASPAKTLMWTGGAIPGVPVRPAAPPAAAPSRPGASPTGKPISPESAASPPGSPSVDAKAAASAEAASKRRAETAEFAVAATMIPPPPGSVVAAVRFPEKPVAGASGPAPGAVDVDISFESSAAPAGAAAPAAGPPAAEPPAAPMPARQSRANGTGASDAAPEWAGSAPSMGTIVRMKGGRRKFYLAAGGVGVAVLAAVGVAVFVGGGKKQSGPDQKPTQVKAVLGSDKAAAPAQPAIVEKPAPPAAAVEPAKPQPAVAEKPQVPAENKPIVAEKVVAPAEKPAQREKPTLAASPAAEKARPVDKKVAADKPAPAEHPAVAKPAAPPRPAVEKPIAEKAKPSSEPAAPSPEKKHTEGAASVAKPATDKTQEATEAFQRGNAKLLNGALPEAIAAFSEALKLNPKDAQSQRGLGLAYAQSGNAAQAVRHLKLYLKASPNAPDRALIEKRIDQLGGR